MSLEHIKKAIKYTTEKGRYDTEIRAELRVGSMHRIPNVDIGNYDHIRYIKDDLEHSILDFLYENQSREMSETIRDFLRVSQPVCICGPEGEDMYRSYHEIYNKLLTLARRMKPSL